MYNILEVCREYGASIIVIPTIGFATLATTKHPWLDNGTYFDAVVSADVVLVEGIYPEERDHSADWRTLQVAFSQRANKRNKPTVFLDKNFKRLPAAAMSILAQTISSIGGEDASS